MDHRTHRFVVWGAPQNLQICGMVGGGGRPQNPQICGIGGAHPQILGMVGGRKDLLCHS